MATIQDVKYQIVDLNKSIASIKVQYKTDAYPDGLLFDLDLPIENGTTLVGQALVDFIMQNAPLAQLSDAETGYAWIQNRKTEAATLDLSSIVVTPLPVNEKTASANQPTTSGTATL